MGRGTFPTYCRDGSRYVPHLTAGHDVQSLVLTSYLETRHKEGAFGRGTKAIEFGSGCGVVGIAAATLGATVTVTDCQWVIPLTLINVEKNREAITAAGGSVTCRELFW